MLYVEQACGRLVVLAGGLPGVVGDPYLGGCITSVGGNLISGGNSKLFFFLFFCILASASSHSPSSVHSGAEERNSAALLSGQSHLGSSRSRPSVMTERNAASSVANSKQNSGATAVGVQIPSQARCSLLPKCNTRRSPCGHRTDRNNPKGRRFKATL